MNPHIPKRCNQVIDDLVLFVEHAEKKKINADGARLNLEDLRFLRALEDTINHEKHPF